MVYQYEPKYPNSQVLKAMKAVNLWKTGQQQPAREVALEFYASGEPFLDENVVRLMWWVMRDMNLKAEARGILKRTYDHIGGGNEYVVDTYFASLLWGGDLVEMQKVATAAFKRWRNHKHNTWAILCNVLQVADEDKSSMFLMLANRQLDKVFKEDEQAHSRQLVWLHLCVMRKMEKYDLALEFLQSDTAKKIFPMEEERSAHVIEFLGLKGLTHDLNREYKTLLRKDDQRDNWHWWDGYFTTLQTLIDAKHPAGDGYDASWDEADAFLAEAAASEAKVETKWPRRATRLAALHLSWLKAQASVRVESVTDALVSGTAEYVAWLKYKPQAHMDVAKFLPLVAGAGRGAELVGLLGKPACGWADIVQLRHAVVVHKLSFALGLYDAHDAAAVQALVKELIELSEAAAPLSKDLEWSEKPHGDDALNVACLVLLDHFTRTGGDKTFLVECLVVMDSLKVPKANTVLQTLQLLLPPMIGVSRQPEIARELDIKFIQLESLTYLQDSTALSLNSAEEIQHLFGRVKMFHDRFDKDYAEIAVSAWHDLTCSKIFEMMGFKACLSNSAVRREAMLELITCRFLASCTTTKTDRDILDEIDRMPSMAVALKDNKVRSATPIALRLHSHALPTCRTQTLSSRRCCALRRRQRRNSCSRSCWRERLLARMYDFDIQINRAPGQ